MFVKDLLLLTWEKKLATVVTVKVIKIEKTVI